MPTGLTEKIYNGTDTSLRSFALQCVKQLGAGYYASDNGETDLPLDKAPELKPSTFHQKCLERAEENLAKWEYLKAHPEEAEAEYKKEREKMEAGEAEARARTLILKERYENMRERVEAWEVPGDFKSLKDLMLEQIDTCIEDDCSFNPSLYKYTPQPVDEWVDDWIKFAKENIERQKESIKKAEESVAKVNRYMAHLYALLDEVEPLK